MKKVSIIILLLISALFSVKAQYSTLNAHSHNDYSNDIPFWLAYYNHFGSIEADIFLVEKELFVAHDMPDIKPDRTLDMLYIQPIVKLVRHNEGKAWNDHTSSFQLMIELKTAVKPTLTLLVEKLRNYPDVFDQHVNENGIRIVITGKQPAPSEFSNYPDFIYFDGNLNLKYNEQQLKRIPLYSADLKRFTSWNGEGDIIEKEKVRLKHLIDSVHSLNKKIRFWNAPDVVNAWKTFMDLGVDYINTDHINELSEFLNDREKK